MPRDIGLSGKCPKCEIKITSEKKTTLLWSDEFDCPNCGAQLTTEVRRNVWLSGVLSIVSSCFLASIESVDKYIGGPVPMALFIYFVILPGVGVMFPLTVDESE